MQQRHLQPGDIMMKRSDGSSTNTIIKTGQSIAYSSSDANIVHAGILIQAADDDNYQQYYVVEMQKDGLKRNRLLIENSQYSYEVFRAKNENTQRGIAEAADMFSQKQPGENKIIYSYCGAISSIFKKKNTDIESIAAKLDKIIENQPMSMYCSEFVMFVLLVVYEQNYINNQIPNHKSSNLNKILSENLLQDTNVAPAKLFQILKQETGYFDYIGSY